MALGNTQRFGVPMGFGGPHAAYFAFKDSAKRSAPGRIIGVSVDAKVNKPCVWHHKPWATYPPRKANSNICTSQVLLANLAGMYAVYHGPEGVKRIATRIHYVGKRFCPSHQTSWHVDCAWAVFDTVLVNTQGQTEQIYQKCPQYRIITCAK